MAEKNKFKPEVTRIRLNPEQAVLICLCYNTSRQVSMRSCTTKQFTTCDAEAKHTMTAYYATGAISS